MSDDDQQDTPSVEQAPVIGLQGRPVLYPPGSWEAAVDEKGNLVKDADGRLLRVR